LSNAQEIYTQLGDKNEIALCRMDLGNLLWMRADYSAAIEHLSAAQQSFNSLGLKFPTA